MPMVWLQRIKKLPWWTILPLLVGLALLVVTWISRKRKPLQTVESRPTTMSKKEIDAEIEKIETAHAEIKSAIEEYYDEVGSNWDDTFKRWP